MPLLRQLEFGFRSTGVLPMGSPGVLRGELVIGPAGETPASSTAETAALLRIAGDLLRATFTSNGIHVSKQPPDALIIARNSFR